VSSPGRIESETSLLGLGLGQQFWERNPLHLGNHLQIQDRDVALASLDRDDEGSVEIALGAQLVLRQSPGNTSFANSIADPA
jgi:hypothetical protein